MVEREEYDNLPDVKYYNAYFRENDGHIEWRRFAQKNNELGVVPKILNKLLSERRAVKKQMKIEKDQFKYKILDAKQLALKVTANSLYGQLGAATSPVCKRDIAACTTSTGREMLIYAKKYDEEILPWIINGLKFAYKKNKLDVVNKIFDLELKDKTNQKIKDKTKQFVTEDIKQLTLSPVIKYGDTDSVFASFGFKDGMKKVKKDESLLIWQDVVKFSRILIRPFIPEEYRFMWDELHEKNYGVIKKLKLPKGPDVLPKPDHHNTLLPIEERFKQFLKEYMEESFLPWLWTLQEVFTKKYKTDSIYLDVLRVKLYDAGNSQIEKLRIEPEIFTEENKCELESKIKKFIDTKFKDYIIQNYWDIPKNKIIRKVKIFKGGKKIIDKRSLTLSMSLGIISGELVKSRLDYPHDLEYEKTYWPFLILTKKRYVGNKYEFDPNKFKQDCMGIVLKRRDNAPIVKEVCGGIISCLINDRDPSKAREFTKECLKKMFDNKYDIKYFLTSKTLKAKASYKDWTRIAHMVLADRIEQRDAGNKPQPGDRIEYAAIEIENKTKKTLQGDRIEIPSYIKDNNLNIDYLFYMTNQIMKPAKQFLDLAIFDADKIFETFMIKSENKKKGRTSILDFCK